MQDATVAGAREGNAGMVPASEVFQMISYNPIFQTEDIEFKNPIIQNIANALLA